MNELSAWFEANPILYGIAFFLGVCLFLLIVFTITFLRAGRSLKPLVFFFGFMAIVAGPQGVGHLLSLRPPGAEPVSVATASAYQPDATAFETFDGQFTHRERLFGADMDPALIQNAIPIFPEVLAKSETAELSFKATGETTLAAAFPDEAAAQEAHDAYGSLMQFQDATGSDAEGWFATRGTAGDRAFLLRSGTIVMVWTGTEDSTIAARRDALFSPTVVAETAIAAEDTPEPQATVAQRIRDLFSDVRVQIAGVALNLAAAVAWFFIMSTWAVKKNPVPGARPVSMLELGDRIRSINDTDVPFDVLPSDNPKRIEVTWRYADARWISIASSHGLRRTHKLVLLLDEGSHCVRAREYWAAYDWSAKPTAFNLTWKGAMGMVFFEYEKRRVFGVQIGPDGRPTGDLSYTYTFNLDEMKQPLIDVVTHAGWAWKPVMLAFRG